MSNGGVIGKSNVTTTAGAAGVWSINQIFNSRFDNIWPTHKAITVLTDFLIIAGGGGGGDDGSNMTYGHTAESGGGAGGYLNSYLSEASGRNSASLNSLSLGTSLSYSVTVGAGGAEATNGSNTSFSGLASDGTSISMTAIGGGRGGDEDDAMASLGGGGDGGSGGGGGYDGPLGTATYPKGDGTTNQGFDGGAAYAFNEYQSLCDAFGGAGWCQVSHLRGGGGGGAGTQGIDGTSSGSGSGGDGLVSYITGTSVTRAAGGSARGSPNGTSPAMKTGSGSSSIGGGGEGGNSSNAGGDGIVILRYPNTFSMTNPGGGLTISTATNGTDKVSSITAGSGTIEFSFP